MNRITSTGRPCTRCREPARDAYRETDMMCIPCYDLYVVQFHTNRLKLYQDNLDEAKAHEAWQASRGQAMSKEDIEI